MFTVEVRPGVFERLPSASSGAARQVIGDAPITSLISAPSRLRVLDEPAPEVLAEHDTLDPGSGDSDTV